MSERYDIAIVGSGAAGLAAALIAKIRNKSFIIFGEKALSQHLTKAPRIENYLGFLCGSGKELLEGFREHIDKMGIEITEERVSNVFQMDGYYSLITQKNNYEATTVIIASGVQYVEPIKGEEKFVGKGVGYCTTCDGRLFRGKTVSIIGYLKEAEIEANFVSEFADKVYYIPLYKDDYKLNKNIEIIHDKPVEIKGEEVVKKLVLENRELDTDGVFVLKNAIPPTELVPGLEIENGHIKVDINMKTNLEGCFAAGDCVGKPYKSIKAAGQGDTAGLSAADYLDKIKQLN